MRWRYLSRTTYKYRQLPSELIISIKTRHGFRSHNTMQPKKVSHVIFDMDGLLLDSETGYDKVITEIAKSFGKELPEETKVKILGRQERDAAKIIIEDLELPIDVDKFMEMYVNNVKLFLQHPPLMPGAERLVKHLHKHDVSIAVATSSLKGSFEVKTKNHKNFFNLFSHVVTGSSDPEVKYGKPAPDIFLVAASRFPDKPDPSKCLVLEDAPNGVKGAISAGMQAVLVPGSEISDNAKASATLVIDSLEDFKPEVFGLPAF